MKQQTFTQYEGIQTNDLDALIKEMNRYQRMHADCNPVGRIETMGDKFVGIVEYTITERIPETELERLEEKNGKHRCYECPCLCMDDDHRKKSYPCAMGGVSRTDSPCCEWFYKALEKGQINVR